MALDDTGAIPCSGRNHGIPVWYRTSCAVMASIVAHHDIEFVARLDLHRASQLDINEHR